MLHKETLEIIAKHRAMMPGTVAESEVAQMVARNHPILAMIDGLLRLAAWQASPAGMECKIADDGFTGPYWLDAAKNVRGMFSSASPRGFDAGTCEAIFWRAMEIAGFGEEHI